MRRGLRKIKSASIAGGIALLFFSGCGGGGGGDCDGTTFVNESGGTIEVSANSLSGIEFDSFTLGDGEENKVCGNDEDDILANYTFADGSTGSEGQTWSGGNFCIYIFSADLIESGACE